MERTLLVLIQDLIRNACICRVNLPLTIDTGWAPYYETLYDAVSHISLLTYYQLLHVEYSQYKTVLSIVVYLTFDDDNMTAMLCSRYDESPSAD